ncbi:hypothetical protein NL676_004661 [Syzygium grande]|nr:hypothetical protein NL676_004661 [Syzygium grande]
MTRPAFSSELHRTRSNEKAGGGGGGGRSQHVSVERGLKWLEPRDVARSIMNELALLPSAERRVDFGGFFEWKQPLVTDLENTLSIAQKQSRVSVRREAVKEKIIISQEQRIQKLYELVRNLKEQLSQCSRGLG